MKPKKEDIKSKRTQNEASTAGLRPIQMYLTNSKIIKKKLNYSRNTVYKAEVLFWGGKKTMKGIEKL